MVDEPKTKEELGYDQHMKKIFAEARKKMKPDPNPPQQSSPEPEQSDAEK